MIIFIQRRCFSLTEQLLAIIFGNSFEPTCEGAAEAEGGELAAAGFPGGEHYVEVYLVDELDGRLAIGIEAVVARLKERTAFAVEKLFGHKSVAPQHCCHYFTVGVGG